MQADLFPMSRPSALLLIQRGWRDPLLILSAGGLAWLIVTALNDSGNLRLEEQVGYSAQRLLLLLWLAALLIGTIQGTRKHIVVFINDDATPGLMDALATLGVVAGFPLAAFVLPYMAYFLTNLLAPVNFTPPRYENYATVLLFIAWTMGGIWMFSRVYAYNRGALSALIALVTKVTWCVIAVAVLVVTGDDGKPGRPGQFTGLVQLLWLVILVFAMLIVINTLTYSGPSLRKGKHR